MKITAFNPLIITKDAASVIALFEDLGFIRRHTKDNIGKDDFTDVRMKDANGNHVDIAQADIEWTMIRMNVDNLEEAVAFLRERGFRDSGHKIAKETVDTGSSKFKVMVSPNLLIFAVSEHIK